MKQRLYGLDILRLMSMIAIVHFHTHEALFYEEALIFLPHEAFYGWFQPYSRFISFSGQTIIALSALLLGRSRFSGRKWATVLLILWTGLYCLALLEAEGDSWFYFAWDIYPYLLVTFSFIFLIQRWRWLLNALAGISFLLLCIPVWEWAASLPLQGAWREILIGDCSGRSLGAWPLLPWGGLPVLFFAIGRGIREHSGLANFLKDGSRQELWFWIPLLATTFFWLGGYYHAHLGSGFNCFVLRRPPQMFWAHMLWIIFFLRLSFLTKANLFLERFSLARGVSQLHWSRHFGLCYALQFLWLAVGTEFTEFFRTHPHWLDAFMLSVIPATELMSRLTISAISRFRQS